MQYLSLANSCRLLVDDRLLLRTVTYALHVLESNAFCREMDIHFANLMRPDPPFGLVMGNGMRKAGGRVSKMTFEIEREEPPSGSEGGRCTPEARPDRQPSVASPSTMVPLAERSKP